MGGCIDRQFLSVAHPKPALHQRCEAVPRQEQVQGPTAGLRRPEPRVPKRALLQRGRKPDRQRRQHSQGKRSLPRAIKVSSNMAVKIQQLLDKEWRERAILPTPPTALPASSAQETHAVPLPEQPPTPIASPAKAATASPKRASAAAPSAPKSPERQMSPEMDVDVGGTPEPESAAQDMALDSESDAIVQQLEKGLPRWEGLSDLGWNADIPQVSPM